MTLEGDEWSRFGAAALAAARRSPWWWSMAANPECEPWCAKLHDVHDFRVFGDINCVRPFGDVARAVHLERWQGSTEDAWFVVKRGPLMIRVLNGDDLTADQADELASNLREAAEFARLAEGASGADLDGGP